MPTIRTVSKTVSVPSKGQDLRCRVCLPPVEERGFEPSPADGRPCPRLARQAAGAMLDDYAARDEVAILGWPVCAGPKVRIPLPPAQSPLQTPVQMEALLCAHAIHRSGTGGSNPLPS